MKTNHKDSKHFLVDKTLVDANLSSVSKHLLYTTCFVTDLTIYEQLECSSGETYGVGLL